MNADNQIGCGEMIRYECGYCGWEAEPEWFWYHAGKNYCSLHLKGRDTPND